MRNLSNSSYLPGHRGYRVTNGRHSPMPKPWMRVTIRSLMLVVAASAGLSAVYRSVGGFAFPILLGYAALIALLSLGPWSLAKGDRQVAARMLVVASVLEFIALAGLGVFCLR